MSTLRTYLTQDHQHCDDLFAEAENDVAAGDWSDADRLFAEFHQDTLLHLAREEQTLFPAFESASGMSGGPTYVMRFEHMQMRDTLRSMDAARAARDAEAYLGLSETLLMLMRQHNMKEEHMLYRMCDQVLADQSGELVQRMQVQTPAA